MQVRSLLSTFGTCCCSVLCGMLAASPAYAQAVQKSEFLVSAPGTRVRLGLERRGSHVAVATVAPKSNIEASRERFVVVRGGASNVLWDLNHLRHHVRISSKASALRFVRLRTTPRTFYFWPFFQQQTEVLSRRGVARLPRYGVDSWRRFRPSADSGWLGVLSSSAYRVGGFSPPHVTRVPGGFRVTRWILKRDQDVSLVQEFVGVDGAYRQKIVKPWKAQPLPRTAWSLPDDEE